MQLFISLFILFFSTNSIHEFHLSNTEVRYNIEENSIQITSRIFIDDFEKALGELGHHSLFLCTEKEVDNADVLVSQYLQKNLLVAIDGKIMDYNFLGKEISDDLIAVWCYMEILNVAPKEQIRVENNILLETFSDQKNIVNIKMDSGEKEMFILQNGKNSGYLKL